jgi:hypothetical protein
MPEVLSPLAPTKTAGKRERRGCTRTSICEAALQIPAVVSCVPHPDEAYNHPLDPNRWLLVGYRHACGHVKLHAEPEAGEDHLGFVRITAAHMLGCPDEKTGKPIHRPRVCESCFSAEDSARVRAQNRLLMPWLYAEEAV